MGNYKNNLGYKRIKVPVTLAVLSLHNYYFLFLQKLLNLPIISQVCCYLLLTNKTFLRIIKIRKENFTSLIQMRAKSSCLIH